MSSYLVGKMTNQPCFLAVLLLSSNRSIEIVKNRPIKFISVRDFLLPDGPRLVPALLLRVCPLAVRGDVYATTQHVVMYSVLNYSNVQRVNLLQRFNDRK
jgi:hypothetical protein